MKLFPNKTLKIKNKLDLIILVASGLAVLVLSVIFIQNEMSMLRQHIQKELQIYAKLSGFSIGTAVMFDNKKDAINDLKAFAEVEPLIQQAYLFNDRDEYFTSLTDEVRHFTVDEPPENPPELIKADGEEYTIMQQGQVITRIVPNIPQWTADYVEILSPLELYGENKAFIGTLTESGSVGWVYLHFSLSDYHNRVYRSIFLVTLTALMSLMLAALLANRLQKMITVPIFNLLNTMLQVSKQKNYSIRAEKLNADELGALVDGFNKMLSQIETNNKELAEYRDQLEEKVIQRTLELADARDQALAASKAKSSFLANMSHEIRTPLNAVLGYTQIMKRDTGISQQQRNFLQNIESSGNHLLSLINDILDLSKIEANAMEWHEETFYLKQFAHELSAMFQVRCEQKGLVWEVDNQVPTSVIIKTDQGKLRQVLINLLGNAVKFTDKGKITFRATAQGSYYRFDVIDTGPGISDAAQAEIFEPFQQDEEGFRKGGTGLGLAISRRYIDMLNGSINLTSKIGQGSQFSVNLALPAGELSDIAKPLANQDYLKLAAGCQLKVLVVDDAPDNLHAMAFLIRDIGGEVYEASNGEEALEQLQAHSVDIVFMDIYMPIMDGLETIKHIRQQFTLQELPCVAVTAAAMQPHGQIFIQAGFNDYILKPFYFEKIYNCLSKWLDVTFEDKTQQNVNKPIAATAELSTAAQQQVALPNALLHNLCQAAEYNQVTLIGKLLEGFEPTTPEQRSLVERLQQLLLNYEMDAILELLEKVDAIQ